MNMIHTYYPNTMPFKVTLKSKDGKIKLVYYKSTTEFLSFEDTAFDVDIQNQRTETRQFFAKNFSTVDPF